MQRRSRSTTMSSRRATKPAAGRARAIRPSSARRTTKPLAQRTPTKTRTAIRQKKGRGGLGAKITTDQETIMRWAEERGGHPASVIRTGTRGEPGVLRIDFPGFTGKGALKAISWDEWFRKFEDRNLAFLYQDHTAAGKLSRFFKLINRSQ